MVESLLYWQLILSNSMPYKEKKELFLKALKHKNPHIRGKAIVGIATQLNKKDARKILLGFLQEEQDFELRRLISDWIKSLGKFDIS